MALTDYIPHAAIGALATVVAYVFKSHEDRDDHRFDKIENAFLDVNDKLDTAIQRAADQHAEVLKILLDRHDV
jgi:hypothetical protein